MIFPFWLQHALIYLLAGAFAGLMSGLLGIGGGIIVVPTLLYLFDRLAIFPDNLAMQAAAGTSLAVMVFTALAAVIAHINRSSVQWPIYYRLWPGLITGVVIGAALAEYLPGIILQGILAFFLLFSAWRMLQQRQLELQHTDFPNVFINLVVTTGIGIIASLLGIGGGILILPYLAYAGVAIRKISAISALCTLTVGSCGALSFMITGAGTAGIPPLATGYIYWPAVAALSIPSLLFAPLGAYLNYRLPVKQLTQVFAIMLALIAIHLLIKVGMHYF